MTSGSDEHLVSETAPSIMTEAATVCVLQKKLSIKISQNSQENICARVSFLIITLLKKGLWHRCFLVNFAKFLRTPFKTEWGEWPSGLRRYNKNRKVPGSKPTRRSAGLWYPTSLRGPR